MRTRSRVGAAGVALVALALLLPAASCRTAPRGPSPGDYVAFSLGEARIRAAAPGPPADELRHLGGMTRLIGVVRDAASGDMILVGQRLPRRPPIQLDDFVVALRARLLYEEWPRVSIDRTEETAKSGLQQVNFAQGVEDTGFGAKLLACDVILKRYSLELLATSPAVPSYRSFCEEEVREQAVKDGSSVVSGGWSSGGESSGIGAEFSGRPVRTAETVQSRFWFFPQDEYTLTPGDGVFVISDLPVGVRKEVRRHREGGTPDAAVDRPADEFAARFTRGLPEIAELHPELKEIDALYYMTAAAEAIYALGGYDRMDYFLKDYPVPAVPTPRQYELHQAIGAFHRADGREHLVQLSGGVELKASIDRLNRLDVGPLPDIVARSRPSAGALSWRVPLAGWQLPSDRHFQGPGAGQGAEPAALGCSVVTQSYLVDVPRPRDQGGDVSRKFFGFPPPPPPPFGAAGAAGPPARLARSLEEYKSRSGVVLQVAPRGKAADLKRERDRINASRPSDDALTWPVEGDQQPGKERKTP